MIYNNTEYTNEITIFTFQVKTRIENERYLREHPEVECLVSGFLQ